MYQIYKINQRQISCEVWLGKLYWKPDTITPLKAVSKIYTLRQVRITVQMRNHGTSFIKAAMEHKAKASSVLAFLKLINATDSCSSTGGTFLQARREQYRNSQLYFVFSAYSSASPFLRKPLHVWRSSQQTVLLSTVLPWGCLIPLRWISNSTSRM